MKKILFFLFIIMLVFIIYTIFKDNKVYYVSMTDWLDNHILEYKYADYVKDYLDEKGILEKDVRIDLEDERIIDIIRYINDNKEFNGNKMQNILIKADLLILSIGYNDLIKNISYYTDLELRDYIKGYFDDLSKLFNLIRKYDKERIVMLGYYTLKKSIYNDIIKDINYNIKKLCDQYKIEFIDIYNLNYLSIEGQHKIFNEIKQYIDVNI